MAAKIHMHQTTVRFGRDTWEVLEMEAERLSVSAAQYVRDATLARLAYTGAIDEQAGASREAFAWAGQAPLLERVRSQLDSATALQAQAQVAHAKSKKLRADAATIREKAEAKRP